MFVQVFKYYSIFLIFFRMRGRIGDKGKYNGGGFRKYMEIGVK